MNLQTKLTSFAAERIDEITETVDGSRQRFMERMRPQFENIESYKDIPDLYQPALQSVKREVKTYFESISKLLEGFIDALESKVESSRK